MLLNDIERFNGAGVVVFVMRLNKLFRDARKLCRVERQSLWSMFSAKRHRRSIGLHNAFRVYAATCDKRRGSGC